MDGRTSPGRSIEIAMTPTGAATPEDAQYNLSEEGNSILSTVQKAVNAWERFYKQNDARQSVSQREERDAILYPEKEQTATTIASTDLAGMELKKRGGQLVFCVAALPNPESFKESSIEESKQAEFRNQRASLEDRLKDFEKHIFESLDPYAVILPYDNFRQVRLRSSSPEVLEQLKNFVEHELGLFETVTNRLRAVPVKTNIQLEWRQTELNNFVVAVKKLTFTWPSSNEQAKSSAGTASSQDLAYVLHAASIDEIEFSASKSIDGLQWMTLLVAVLVALVTFGAATYLTRPLSKIESIAKEIGRHGFSPDAKLEEHIHSLLEQLPTARRDEVGTLSKQFKETTKQVLLANKELRESKDREMAEQRKNEQAERNKAIADEVSQAVMLLLASVSHDMRQPLNPIFFYTERLLQKPTLSDDDRRALTKILRSARGLSFLVEDILDYKRILAGDVVLNVEEVDIETMLADLKEDYATMAQTRGTTISISNEWHGKLHADGNRLKRVLNNLISNACKATQKGSINLRIVPYGIENVEISVRDTGCGMDDSVKRLLFEAPERQVELARQYGVRHSNKDPNSTRIGLFVCKQLIEAMGGTIQCSSEVGKGSEFVVRLPVRALESIVSDQGSGTDVQQTAPYELQEPAQPVVRSSARSSIPSTTRPVAQPVTPTAIPAKNLGVRWSSMMILAVPKSWRSCSTAWDTRWNKSLIRKSVWIGQSHRRPT